MGCPDHLGAIPRQLTRNVRRQGRLLAPNRVVGSARVPAGEVDDEVGGGVGSGRAVVGRVSARRAGSGALKAAPGPGAYQPARSTTRWASADARKHTCPPLAIITAARLATVWPATKLTLDTVCSWPHG